MKVRLVGAVALLAAVGLAGCGSDVGSSAASAAQSAAAGIASAGASAAQSAAAGVASSAAAAASSAIAGATDGLCQSLTPLQDTIAGQASDTATVGEVRALAEQANQELDQVKAEAGPAQTAVVSALQAAENALLSTLQGQADDTPMSEATPGTAAAVQAVQNAYSTLTETFNCTTPTP